MKILGKLMIAATGVMLFASCCVGGDKCPFKDMSVAQYDSTSYAVGVSFGHMLKNANITALNYSELNKGIKDVFAGVDTSKISQEEVGRLIESYIKESRKVKNEKDSIAEQKFFAENITKDSVQATESGLQYKIINAGSELRPNPIDTVEVMYTGRLLNGTEFDKSDTPIKFVLNRVIPGWTEGLQLIGEGGKAQLWVPFKLGYGDRAMGPNLPANSTLNFEVELIKIYRAPQEALEAFRAQEAAAKAAKEAKEAEEAAKEAVEE